jgi:capsular polysaccharide biosynthesis protein
MIDSDREKLGQINGEDAVSLLDVVRFFMTWWRLILSAVVIAVLLAWWQLTITPPQYEAQTIITMARSSEILLQSDGVIVNAQRAIESPEVLSERLGIPTAFSAVLVAECQFNSSNELLSHFRVMSISGPNGTLRYAVQHHSSSQAKVCVEAIFRTIRDQQSELLQMDAERKDLMLGNGRTILYGAEVRMLVPVYASDEPVSPRTVRFLLAWGMGGFLIGMVLGLSRTFFLWLQRIRKRGQLQDIGASR